MEEQTTRIVSETPPPILAAWFVVVNNEKNGPIKISEISRMASEGIINRSTLGWKKGMSEWLPLVQIPELTSFFSGGPVRSPIDNEKFQKALDVSKRSSKEAFNAFRAFIINPLSGLPATYQALGKNGSVSVSIVFLIAYEIMTFFGLGVFRWPSTSIGDYLKLIIAFAVPYGGVMVSLLMLRMIRKAPETWHADLYIASSAALLGGIGFTLAGIVGIANFEFAVIVIIIEFCLLIYILHSGLERIYKYSERFTIWMIPIIIVFCIWLSKMIIVRLLQNSMKFW